VGDDTSLVIVISYDTNKELKPDLGDSLSVHNVYEEDKVREEESEGELNKSEIHKIQWVNRDITKTLRRRMTVLGSD
jgi:hypothetical protein